MKRNILAAIAAPAVVALSLTLASCGGGDDNSGSDDSSSGSDTSSSAEMADSLAGAGASSQAKAMEVWQVGFQTTKDITVDYASVGSGAGRTQFVDGGVAFAGSDAYLKDEQLEAAKERCGGEIIEIPSFIAPIAVFYNLEGVDSLQLSPATIAGIFNGDITTWNDETIAADNPGVELPSDTITPVHRSDESGTTENFVEYLAATAPDVWTHEVSGDWPTDGGEAAKGTSGVVSAVQGATGAIGYADAGQVTKELNIAKVKVGEEYVELTSEAAAKVVDASDAVEGRGDYDFAIDVKRDTTESGTYPVVLVSYMLACTKYDDTATANTVKEWLTYVTSDEAQTAAKTTAGNAPISETTRAKAKTAIDAIQ